MDIVPLRGLHEINQLDRSFFKKKDAFFVNKKKRSTKKIPFIILERIFRQNSLRSCLLFTMQSPQTIQSLTDMFNTLLTKEKANQSFFLKEITVLSNKKNDCKDKKKLVPIKIRQTGHNSWINALLQWIIAVPSIYEMFPFTPKSLASLTTFIQEYKRASEKKQLMIARDSKEVLDCLRKHFSSLLFDKKNTIDFFGLLESIMRTLPLQEFLMIEKPKLMAFYPHSRFSLKEKENLHFSKELKKLIHANYQLHEEIIVGYQRPISSSAPHLIGVNENLFLRKRRFSLENFIEYRPDQWDEKGGNYFAYIKVDSIWYQCSDSHILPVDNSYLPIALLRGVLFHFQEKL